MALVGTPGALPAVPATAGFLGQGVKYPPEADAAGRLRLSSGLDSVEEALKSIFATYPGERVMQPDYGAGVALFEPFDASLMALAVRESIDDHEPRVASIELTASQTQAPGEVIISAEYQLATEATSRTLTYAYFKGPEKT